MPTVRIPPPFRRHVDGQAEVKVDGATVGAGELPACKDLSGAIEGWEGQSVCGVGRLLVGGWASVHLSVPEVQQPAGAERGPVQARFRSQPG